MNLTILDQMIIALQNNRRRRSIENFTMRNSCTNSCQLNTRSIWTLNAVKTRYTTIFHIIISPIQSQTIAASQANSTSSYLFNHTIHNAIIVTAQPIIKGIIVDTLRKVTNYTRSWNILSTCMDITFVGFDTSTYTNCDCPQIMETTTTKHNTFGTLHIDTHTAWALKINSLDLNILHTLYR